MACARCGGPLADTNPDPWCPDCLHVIPYAALERAGHVCALDAEHITNLNVHHRTYVRRGYEEPGDLIVLCRACHDRHHKRDSSLGRILRVEEAVWDAIAVTITRAEQAERAARDADEMELYRKNHPEVDDA